MQAFLFIQPSAGLVDIPFRIYTGTLAGKNAFVGIALQLVWTAVFVIIGHQWMKRVLSRLEIQGG
jgi:ABC-2 type transport system permease protein